jgi:hypothetical protein
MGLFIVSCIACGKIFQWQSSNIQICSDCELTEEQKLSLKSHDEFIEKTSDKELKDAMSEFNDNNNKPSDK